MASVRVAHEKTQGLQSAQCQLTASLEELDALRHDAKNGPTIHGKS